MIKNFVLKWIRTHMSHETSNDRDEIFRAINDGCNRVFYEDNTQTRLSWMVGELVRNDREFIGWLDKNPTVNECVAGATYDEIAGIVSNHRRVRAQQRNYRSKQLINNRK